MGVICTHVNVGGGGTLLRWEIPLLDLVSIMIGTNSAHLDVAAWCRTCFVFVFTTQRRVITLVRAADRRRMYSSSRGLDVDSLDGTAKGDGDTDDDNDATWACGRSA